MAKDDVIEVEGKVVDTMPNAMFTVDTKTAWAGEEKGKECPNEENTVKAKI